MATSVTIPGANTGPSTITVGTFDNTANHQLAQQIANALVLAQGSSRLAVSTVAGGAVSPPPATTPPGGINELIINGPGNYVIPPASGTATDYVVVINPAILGSVTVHGAPNSTIMGGNANVTIVDPAAIALGEEAGNAKATINGSNDVLAGNNLNDTLTAAGVAGSISGGTGANLFIDTGSNDTISAHGHGDTIRGGPGKLTVQIVATDTATAGREMVIGGEGALFVTDAAIATNLAGGDTIFGGDGLLNVILSGNFARVVETGGGGIKALDSGTSDTIVAGGSAAVTLAGSIFGSAGANGALVVGQGNLSVIDNGIGDTITAGLGFTSVSAASSKAFVVGGAGALNFVGGAGNSTVMGGSGNATLTGGSGATSLFGGAGGSMIYRNLDGGSLFYQAQSGNETIDASLSAGNGLYLAGRDSLGQNLIKGGSGSDAIIAGTGAATLVGGGGADFFDFFSSLGSPSVNVVIGDFSAIDNVMLISYGAGEAANAIAGATTAGGSTTITLSDHTKITFTGVTNSGALSGHIQQA